MSQSPGRHPGDDAPEDPWVPWYVLNLDAKFADLDRHIAVVTDLLEVQAAQYAAERRRYMRRRPRSATV